MTREEVKKEILNRWDSIWELFDNNFNVEIDRLKIKTRKDHKQELMFDVKRKRGKNKYLKIVLSNKSLSSKDKGVTDEDVLIEVVNKAGIDNVYELNIPVKGNQKLIEKNTGKTAQNGYRILSSKWVIFVKTGIDEKYTQIDEIIKKRKLNATVCWEK